MTEQEAIQYIEDTIPNCASEEDTISVFKALISKYREGILTDDDEFNRLAALIREQQEAVKSADSAPETPPTPDVEPVIEEQPVIEADEVIEPERKPIAEEEGVLDCQQDATSDDWVVEGDDTAVAVDLGEAQLAPAPPMEVSRVENAYTRTNMAVVTLDEFFDTVNRGREGSHRRLPMCGSCTSRARIRRRISGNIKPTIYQASSPQAYSTCLSVVTARRRTRGGTQAGSARRKMTHPSACTLVSSVSILTMWRI